MTDLLGSVSGLATALGVTKDGWFAAPDTHLKTILSDSEQREALIGVIDDLLGGEDATTEGGRTLVPIAGIDPVDVYATLTERDGLIDIGLLVRVAVPPTADTVGGRLEFSVPLVAASGDSTATEPLLLGTEFGALSLHVSLELPTTRDPGPGGIDLRAAELTLRIPTDSSLPDLGLGLLGLVMPGATAPVDVVVAPDSVADLGDSVLQLVLGLVQAQLDAAPAEVRAIAGLLGLVDADGVPDFPIAELIEDGPAALARWWARALADDVRDAWYAHLRTLLGGTASTIDAFPAVDVTLAGSLRLRVSVRSAPGAAGLPQVTPVLAVVTDAADGVELALVVEPVSLDLATGAAVPLPSLRIGATIAGSGAAPLLSEQVVVGPDTWQLEVGSVLAGFALTADRTPQFVLSAFDVTVGLTEYAVLDLTSGDALAAVGADVLSDAAGAVLGQLGAVGDALSAVLGLGAADFPIDPQRLLADPLGAVRDRWRRVLAEAPADVRTLLEPLRDAFASSVAAPIEGDGTPGNPYRFELVDGLSLTATVDGTRVAVALEGSASADLGSGRMRLDARVGLLRADLDDGHPTASLVTDIAAALSVVAAGGGVLELGDDDTVAVRTRGFGARVRWRPGTKPDVVPWLRDPEITVAGRAVDLAALRDAGVLEGGTTPLADVAAQALDEASAIANAAVLAAAEAAQAWASAAAAALADAVEQLAAGVLSSSTSEGLDALRRLLAWGEAAAGAERLALDALVADPPAELRRWIAAAFGVDPVAKEVVDAERLLAAVARLAETAGLPVPDASAAVGDPLSLVLPGLEILAEVAGDDAARLVSRVTGALEGWTPGDPLPDAAALLSGLAADAGVDGVLADVLAGRSISPESIEGLVARWAETDGVVGVATSALPAGLNMQRIDGLLHGAPLSGAAVRAAVAAALGAAPARLVLVGVQAEGEPTVLPIAGDAGIDLDIDLTAAGAPPASFSLPGAAPAGVTVVRLPGKSAAVSAGTTLTTDSGFDAQVARLSRILADLGTAGDPVVVVAGGAAGRVAVEAAAGTPIATVLTVGTPWSPLALGDVDTGAASEALRLLSSLADLGRGDDPVDAAVQRGRDLVDALLARDVRGDPLTELAAPSRTLPTGLDVRALVGRVDADEVREAITALVRRALDVRSASRTAAAAAADAISRAGVRIPLEWGSTPGGIRAKLETDLDLASIASAAVAGDPTPRQLSVRLRVWGDRRWLIGGPDPGRSPGSRPLALRALTIEADIPLPALDGAGGAVPLLDAGGLPLDGGGRVILHDALVFGVRRARWQVDLSNAGALLPELRALLGELAASLQRTVSSDPAARAIVDLLTALGLVGPDGGFDAVTLTTLLSDPGAVARSALAETGSREALAAALRSAAGDVRPAAGSTVRIAVGTASTIEADLGALTLTARARVGAGTGLVPSLEASVAASRAGATLSLDLSWAAGFGVVVGLAVDGGGGDVTVTAGLAIDAYGHEILPVWPPSAAAASAQRLGEAALRFARDAAVRLGVQALRDTLAAAAQARALIDAVLDATGLLAAADAAGARTVVWPGGFIADPGGWLTERAGGPAAALPRLLRAAADALGVVGSAPGTLRIVDGLELGAATTPQGALRVGLRVDASAFADVPGFVLAVDAAALIRPGAAPVPAAAVTIGTSAGALEIGVGQDAGGTDAAIGVTVALRPSGSAAIVLYPSGTGFGSTAETAANAAGAAVQVALPFLLTRLARRDPAGDPDDALEIAARVVSRAGLALGLAHDVAGELVFDPAAFRAFIDTPGAALQSALGSIVTQALTLLRDAAAALFDVGDDFEVEASGGVLTLTVGPDLARVTLSWDSATNAIGVGVATDAIPIIGQVRGSAVVSGSGVNSVNVVIGPTTLDFGVVALTPLARFAWTPVHTSVEIGLAAGDETRVIARLARTSPAPWDFTLVAETGLIDPATLLAAPEGVLEDDAAIAGALARTMLGLAADVVLSLEPVSTFLDTDLPVGGISIRDVLDGVVLDGDHLDLAIIDELDEQGKLLDRLGELVSNLAPALPNLEIAEGLGIGIDVTDDVLGLRLVIASEVPLNEGDVIVSLVADDAWIDDTNTPGVRVGMVRFAAGTATPELKVELRGAGIRFSKSTGPLLDAGLRIESLRLLAYADVEDVGGALRLGGGVSVSLEGLGLDLGGGGDGSNPIAEGVMPSGGSDDDAPRPAFSPTLDIIKRPTDADVQVSVRAGTTPGPWWLTIQREFGPIYLEQVGLDVTTSNGSIATISILIDGAVSLFGFAASVDDLSLTYHAPGSPFAPASWAVDVAGFAIRAETSGLTLAGGLRKFTPTEGGVEYLGMLLARFGTYGLTVYGGFAQVGPPDDQYLSLFLIGGVNGPIGGVPAFFVTGIAGGFGVNRRLIVPKDLNEFPRFALIRALDSAAADVDPFAEIANLRRDFPAERGSFWFAAGIAFNSFVLVDGIVVIAIEFGNGFELNIMGLARMSLPRPQLTLVSIELALIARVSSREGIILVQAQLTDNSWLLNPTVRLTGGFAFAAWFAGPNKGQFVLTMGGYHPDFHRDGYPVVPRLGIEWRIGSAIVISGKTYFALTSEALMAGVKIEIHAELGPAWAHVVLGADAIIYFDPFWLQATVYASIDAGITIDVWIGEITISVHIGARITIEGPPFHARATLEIGPASVTLEIGPSNTAPQPLDWQRFLEKYLEDAGGGNARALSAVTGKGTVPPSGGGKGGAPAPDGQPDRPYKVIAEFTVTLTSMVPLARYQGAALSDTTTPDGAGNADLRGVPNLAVAPMQKNDVKPKLNLAIRKRAANGSALAGDNYQSKAGVTGRYGKGDFPWGVWGPVLDEEQVPEGELIVAPNSITIDVAAVIDHDPEPPAIPYHQVRTDKRRMLPLLPSVASAQLAALRASASAASSAVDALRVPDPLDSGRVPSDTAIAQRVLAARGGLGVVRAADWRAGLAAPVRLGSLGQDIGTLAPEATFREPLPVVDPAMLVARPARVKALLAAPVTSEALLTGAKSAAFGTSVSPELLARVVTGAAPQTMSAPTIAAVAASLDAAIPSRLVRAAAVASIAGSTVLTVARGAAVAEVARGATVASRTTSTGALETLRERGEALVGDGFELAQGEVVVLELPDGARDNAEQRPVLHTQTGPARVVVFGGGGAVIADFSLAAKGRAMIPIGARGLAVIAGGANSPTVGFAVLGGWHDTSLLPSASGGALVGAGCVVNAVGVFAERDADAPVAWTTPAAITKDMAPTTTTFTPAGEGRSIQAIAVGVTGAGSDGVAIGLENAEPDGDPIVTTDADGSSVVVVAVRASGEGPVVVNAAIEEGRDVTGVFAASASSADDPATTADLLAKAVAARGLRALDRPVSAAGPAVTRIRWSSP